jgi:hypothetical protein
MLAPATLGVSLADGYPRLRRDVRRRLRQGSAALAADRLRARISFTPLDGDARDLYAGICSAYVRRNEAAGRPVDLAGFGVAWGRATEAGTLRIGGKLAAWLLAVPGPDAYLVLAGQMAPGWERYRPGRLLEAVMLGRALAAGYRWVDWGSDRHASSLIAVSP